MEGAGWGNSPVWLDSPTRYRDISCSSVTGAEGSPQCPHGTWGGE